MKTNFVNDNKFYMPVPQGDGSGYDAGGSGGGAAKNKFPLGLALGGLQFLGGLGQVLFSGKKRTERDLENYAATYKGSPSILDFYNKSLNKYSANPYTSLFYKNQKNAIDRSLATGISATQDRRAGVGSIGALVQNANDATARAAVTADNQSRADLQTLGQASAMRAREDEKKFDLKYNLLAMKAGAANAQKAAGWQNIFGGLGAGSNYLMAKQMYGS